MHLLPIKLLVIVTLITSVQGKNLPKKTRRRPLFLVSGSQQRKENGSELGIVELSLISHLEELPEASTVLEGVTRGQTNKQMTQKTEQSQVLPMSSPAKESARGSLGDIKRKESPTASDDAFGVQSRSTPPDPKFAKKFWNHFLVRRGSALQDLILPMKADEMQQETCAHALSCTRLINMLDDIEGEGLGVSVPGLSESVMDDVVLLMDSPGDPSAVQPPC
ncbi:cerberus [Callorhinchus milii]|uniref:cerberus n=1 Tax=Callorhinchus milii TaxID=7868 RepID=UPI001C3FAF18|nr:cerberus [Callorhinchus milii]